MVAVDGGALLRLVAVGAGGDASETPFDAGRHGIGERHHLRAVDVVEVEDVLAAHHPATDHAVADGVAHPANRTSGVTTRPCPTRSAPPPSHRPICAP